MKNREMNKILVPPTDKSGWQAEGGGSELLRYSNSTLRISRTCSGYGVTYVLPWT